jgi:Trk K+ transport system NAD-binding subunit
VFGIFALADIFQPESGLVTVTVFGVWLANMRGVDLENILAFKETLSIVLISLLFIILAARIDFADLQALGWGALLICLVIQFLARPVSIMVSTRGSTLSQAERHFMAWIAPRGIVAAAISSLFALKLEKYGYEDATILVPLVFMVIIFTVLLQSLTAVPLAKMLRVTLPEPEGFLVFGGNRVARTIARGLLDNDVKVMVTDSSKERIARVEEEGLPAYRGNPLSEHAEYNLQLAGLGNLLAMSPYESENIVVAYHYRREFGKNNIYTLQALSEHDSSKATMSQLRGRKMFTERCSYAVLSKLIENGATMNHVTMEKKFDVTEFHEKFGKEAVPLFAIAPKNTTYCFTDAQVPGIDEGWRILYLG